MTRRLCLGSLLCLACLQVMTAAPGRAASSAPSSDTAPRGTARPPAHLVARIRRSESTLIAGQRGFLDIDVSLPAPDSECDGPFAWDLDEPGPILWITAFPESGIVFDDQIPGDDPVHSLMVRLPPPDDGTQVYTAHVEYSVSPRAKAGDHVLWLDVSGAMIGPDGRKVADAGVICSPFQVDTRLQVKLLMLGVIAATIFLFIVEWVRVDVVAMLVMVLLPELGLIRAQNTFSGLSSNAVVAIIGVMIISAGLNRVGIVGRATRSLLPLVGHSASRLIVVFSGLIAVISSVMQNTGAAVLFLPGIRIAACSKLRVPLSRVLMPIGMAAILGGTLTMVGTSPLILLNDLLPPGMPKFGLLELTPIGLALVISGIAYLSIAAKVSLGRTSPDDQQAPGPENAEVCFTSYEDIDGPYEIVIPAVCNLNAGPLEIVQIRRKRQVNIVAMLATDETMRIPTPPGATIDRAKALLAFGPAQAVMDFVEDYGLLLKSEPNLFRDYVHEPSLAGTVELVISPRSQLAGKTIKDIGFRDSYNISALALHQGGQYYYQDLADRPLQPGDAILVHGTWRQLHALRGNRGNFIIISHRETEFQRPERVRPALISFGLALGLMLLSSLHFQNADYNPIPLSICLMIGAVGMILGRVITISEAYGAVDWRTVFLLGGLIPLGMAMNQTGTAAWIARGTVAAIGPHMTPLLLLFVLAVMSCGFTLVISNVGACALLVPLGMSMAAQTGVDPRVAAIVVGIGVSNSFILPTHQVNALYMGPGEYRTGDYIKIGGLLSLIYILVLVSVTYLVYL